MDMCFTNLYSDNKLDSTGLFSSFTASVEAVLCISAKADHAISDEIVLSAIVYFLFIYFLFFLCLCFSKYMDCTVC